MIGEVHLLDPSEQLILDLIEGGHLGVGADGLDVVGLGFRLDGLRDGEEELQLTGGVEMRVVYLVVLHRFTGTDEVVVG